MTQWGLDTLFNPAKRHMDEEKRRLQSTREEVGDNSGGKRIDLDSGRVVIAKQDGDAASSDTSDADPSDGSDASAGSNASATSDADPSVEDRADSASGATTDQARHASAKELTPAQLRALKRRGREPR